MWNYRAYCKKVVDGDTFDFDVDLGFKIKHQIRVRLEGLDTPEKNSKSPSERDHANGATVEAEKLLLEKTCTITTQKDRLGIYGRYTATVTLPDGRDLATVLRLGGFEKRPAEEYEKEDQTA